MTFQSFLMKFALFLKSKLCNGSWEDQCSLYEKINLKEVILWTPNKEA